MQREVTGWYSPALDKYMDVAVYGHYGFALLLIPTADSDFLEYEHHGLIGSIQPYIDAGQLKVFCVGSINAESWMNPYMEGREKALRNQHYIDYIFREVIPFVREKTSDETPIIAAGAAFGALQAANLFFKHPDLINGIIAMSGCYDLSVYSQGYYDDNVYFNSPVHYLPNLSAEWHLCKYRQSRNIHFVSGSGDYEDPNCSRHISTILSSKGVAQELDIWGPEYAHEWSTWHQMMRVYLETRF